MKQLTKKCAKLAGISGVLMKDRYKLSPSDKPSIEVGDIVTKKTMLGIHTYEVFRVTKRFAVAKLCEMEYRFPRVFDYCFTTIPRPRFNYHDYEVWRLLPQSAG